MHADTQQLQTRFPTLNSPDLLTAIAQNGSQAGLQGGMTICEPGQQCSHLALVLSGNARVYQLAENGREITLYRVSAGECCIMTVSCIMSQQGFPALAVCDTDLQAVLIPANKVTEWMHQHPQWHAFIWQQMSRRLDNVLHLLNEVTFQRMDQRILRYLMLNHETSGSTLLKLTHQKVADDLGTSREVVSRILKDLEHRTLLHLSRGTVELLDLSALENQLALCD